MRRLRARDHAMYRTVSNGKLVDQGNKVIYKVTGMSLEENKNYSDLYVYDFKQKLSRKLTTDRHTTGYQIYDDQTILVIRKKGAQTDINKIDIATGEEVVWVTLNYQVNELLLLNKKQIAFTAKHNTLFDREEFANDQYADGTPKSKLLEDYYFFDEVKFRSNDEGIVNGVRTRLYIYDGDTQEVTLISDPDLNVSSFDWGGGELIYATDDTSNPEAVTMALKAFNLANKQQSEILPSGTYTIRKVFAFAKAIMFMGYDLRTTHPRENAQMYALKKGEISIIYSADSDIRSVAGSTDVKLVSGDKFKKGDEELYLCLCDDGIERIASLNLQGNITYLTSGFDYIGGFDITQDKIIMELMTDCALMELYTYSEDQTRKLTVHNDAVFAEVSCSPITTFTYTSNGSKIKGYVIQPVNMEAGKQYPGILMIHGGPRGLYTKVYQHRMQVLANAGYYVFFTNPHGSASRGNGFSSIFGQHGEVDYSDLMTFTDEVLKRHPQLDEKRLGVTGHSYGGIMTNVIISKTNRFAAAVSSASLGNYITKAYTTDNGLGASMKIYGDPSEDPVQTWERSPLYNVKRITTPTLFLHSEADYRCYHVESIQMYTALKRYGVDTAMYLFKGEAHGIKKPRNKVKWLEVLLAWFDKYLKE